MADCSANVLPKCGKKEPSPNRTGAPRKKRYKSRVVAKPYLGGRRFFLCPKKGRALNAIPMYRPGNNDLVLTDLARATRRYPCANCFVYDRACRIAKDVSKRTQALWGIRTYATDKCRGSIHKDGRLANPYARPELMRRTGGINTSVGEKTFSRHRCCAGRMNEPRQAMRWFLVPTYAAFRNALIASGETSHLGPYSQQVKRLAQKPYERDEALGEAPPNKSKTGERRRRNLHA